MRNFLILLFYRSLVNLSVMALKALRKIAPFLLPSKMRYLIDLKNQINRQSPSASPIMIHAASGEIEYAKPLIREIKKLWPQHPILITFTSPSALALMKNLEGVEIISALPWDTAQDVKSFLDYYRPKMILIARTDLWPELLLQAKNRDIPSYLFSASIHRENAKLRGLASVFYKLCLELLSQIFVVSEQDAEALSLLKLSTPIHVTGDTRFDQVKYRIEQNNPAVAEDFAREKYLCLGSTWSEDEKMLWPLIESWAKKGGKIFWAPHEIDEAHFADIERLASNSNLSLKRWSQINSVPSASNATDIILIDRIGLLVDLYKQSHAAFVGGSFKQKVHSVMEPIMNGLPVAVGPFYLNNREAIEFSAKEPFEGIKIVSPCLDESSLVEWGEQAWSFKNKIGLKKEFTSYLGASQRVLSLVLKQAPV